jgi:multidrug transporter EmrE-like cation transporter
LSSAVTITKPIHDPAAQRRAAYMVAFATLLGAAAQILMKYGTNYSLDHPGLMGILTDIPLIAGYGLYGVMTVLIVIAFKDGELSVLYPVISLSYVWVTALSYFVFHDSLNPYKLVGLALIIGGVAVIGRGSKA